MPTINLTALAKIALKLIIIGILATIIIGYVGSLVNILIDVITHLKGSINAVNGLNMGWFSNAIGLVDFLNALMQSLFIAGGIFLSGIITILGFKWGSKFYNNLLKV